MNHIKMIVAGGCHVKGYPYEEKFGFVSKSVEQLSENDIQCEIIKTLSTLPISKPKKVEEICQELKPDVLVLQLGNYESCPNYKTYIRSIFGIQKQTRTKKNSPISSTTDSYVFLKFGLKWHLKNYFKYLVDFILLHRVVDLKSVEVKIQYFYSSISKLNIKHVVVLSPLPCADSTVLYHRRKINNIFKENSVKYRFKYINVLDSKNLGVQNNIFSDSIHLNEKGHELLGTFLGKSIFEHIKKKI